MSFKLFLFMETNMLKYSRGNDVKLNHEEQNTFLRGFYVVSCNLWWEYAHCDLFNESVSSALSRISLKWSIFLTSATIIIAFFFIPWLDVFQNSN